VDQSLSKLLSSSDRIDSALNTISEVEPIVQELSEDASALHEVVIERAEVAERISSKVRVLDLEQSRVKDCIDRVQSAAELKDAFNQLFQAIEYADWEAATRHAQRAIAIDRGFLTSQFVEAVVVSPQT
jgi:predicted nuclease with TOPRIM domain